MLGGIDTTSSCGACKKVLIVEVVEVHGSRINFKSCCCPKRDYLKRHSEHNYIDCSIYIYTYGSFLALFTCLDGLYFGYLNPSTLSLKK